MTRECLKNNSGLLLLLTKTDSDYISSVYDYASYVEIVDWSQLDGGLLGITVEGKNIVKLSDYANLMNQFINRVTQKKLTYDIDYLVPQKYQILSKFYKKIYPEIKAYIFHIKPKYNDANWLGFRLIECLAN